MTNGTVLVTGAAGGVAQLLLPGLDDLKLRAVDNRPISGWPAAETVVGDLTDPAFTAAAVDGVDAVIHLAGNPSPEASWSDLRGPNGDAVVQLLESARAAGVRRVVLASSVHAMGGYYRPGEVVVDPSWPARPCCTYGATKVFAEAAGFALAASSEVSVICLRLGACMPELTHEASLPAWLAPDDLQQLTRASLVAEVRYGTYFGVSANTRGAFDYGNATRELGYQPRFDSESYAGHVIEGPDGGLCQLDHYAKP